MSLSTVVYLKVALNAFTWMLEVVAVLGMMMVFIWALTRHR